MIRPLSPLPFEIRRSSIQGRGAFATRAIRKGARIAEYTGERIDQDEADRRYDDGKMQRHHTFLFALDGGMTIDGAADGNDSRFINHSCDPNCAAYEEKGRIFIEALESIQPGDELAYDYSYARTEDTTAEDEELYRCKCGAASCRGSILAPEAKRKPKARPKTKAAPKTARKAASKTARKSAKRSSTKSAVKAAPGTVRKAASKTAKKTAKKTATRAAKKTATKAAEKTATRAAKKTATRAAKKTAKKGARRR